MSSAPRWIIHLDMDAFYAAVEQHDEPALRGLPVIVGGPPGLAGGRLDLFLRSRPFGVHSAMPLREAARRCPDGVFVPVRMWRYVEVSRQVFAILDQYSPLVEPLSLDEAFLDVTGCEKLFGPALVIARQLVARIQAELGLPASVGVAPNKFLAKSGLGSAQTGGFVVVRPGRARPSSRNCPSAGSGAWGPRPRSTCRAWGSGPSGPCAPCPGRPWRRVLGETGILLYELSRGQDERPVVGGEAAKSIGQEVTFQHDTADREYLAGTLLLLADRVARRARKAGVHRAYGRPEAARPGLCHGHQTPDPGQSHGS